MLLVEYLAGRRRWPELQLTTPEELAELDLDLHPGTPVTAIDRDRQCVRTANGLEYGYDRLVLATGSRARRLPDLPAQREGVVTPRSREDAHAAMALVTPESRVLIVGGGLLGLELAAALAGQVAAVTVMQNRSLLLGRQLDATGSEVLRDALIERGVRLMCNDRVASYTGAPRISGVRTEGGLILDCDLLLAAVDVAEAVRAAEETTADAGADSACLAEDLAYAIRIRLGSRLVPAEAGRRLPPPEYGDYEGVHPMHSGSGYWIGMSAGTRPFRHRFLEQIACAPRSRASARCSLPAGARSCSRTWPRNSSRSGACCSAATGCGCATWTPPCTGRSATGCPRHRSWPVR